MSLSFPVELKKDFTPTLWKTLSIIEIDGMTPVSSFSIHQSRTIIDRLLQLKIWVYKQEFDTQLNKLNIHGPNTCFNSEVKMVTTKSPLGYSNVRYKSPDIEFLSRVGQFVVKQYLVVQPMT